jgi:hypothetical protein
VTSFTDDFNRPDSTDLGAGWVEVSGDWSIISQQLSPGAAGGTIILRAATAMASNDNYAQVTIAATTAASQGVWCRGSANISSGYLWRNNGSSWDLFAVVGGSFLVIGTYAAAAAPGDVARVQAVGSTIRGFVNGIERVNVTNTDVPTGVNVGIRSESSGALRYDNFAAADITAGATLTPAASTETAQALSGAKTAALGPAAAVGSALALTGAKTQTLGLAAAQETAQPLGGSKTLLLVAAGSTEAALLLTGSKTATLGVAVETAAAQSLTGAKAALLLPAGEVEAAQALAVALSRSIGPASAVESAQQLTGTKTATLGTAVEVASARPLAAVGPDVDIDITVGAPHGSAYTVGEPQPGKWEVGTPW